MAIENMPSTKEVEEQILEDLLDNNKIHALITDMAKMDIEARGLPMNLELITMGQTRFLAMILTNIASNLLD